MSTVPPEGRTLGMESKAKEGRSGTVLSPASMPAEPIAIGNCLQRDPQILGAEMFPFVPVTFAQIPP